MRALYTLALLAVGFCAVASSVHAQENTEGWEVEPILMPVRFDTLVVEGRGANAVLTFSYTARTAGDLTFRLLATDEQRPDRSPQPIEIARRLREGESGTERVPMRLIPNRDYTLMVTAEGGGELDPGGPVRLPSVRWVGDPTRRSAVVTLPSMGESQ